ncbi:hypothetical protein Anas_10798 [Armadillidium nasatum]|uniref:Uncharacterized protein n=1 Tax=Armadillidium nasatum TaxID=96803 RepID=A0A5N5SZ68_9CRUS|nr:hypothetical protein Anas_10798 [Armadillidium nasatum]
MKMYKILYILLLFVILISTVDVSPIPEPSEPDYRRVLRRQRKRYNAYIRRRNRRGDWNGYPYYFYFNNFFRI